MECIECYNMSRNADVWNARTVLCCHKTFLYVIFWIVWSFFLFPCFIYALRGVVFELRYVVFILRYGVFRLRHGIKLLCHVVSQLPYVVFLLRYYMT